MPEYVEKIRVAVKLCMSGQEPMGGQLSLSPSAQFHAGPETLLERLNAHDRVIPFHRSEDDAVLLVSRIDIDWVAPGRGVDAELVCPRTYIVTREERVRVCLQGGEEIDGLLRMELPEMLNRASDFLNAADDFFPIATKKGVCLVNKLRVSSTRVYESSPAPLTS